MKKVLVLFTSLSFITACNQVNFSLKTPIEGQKIQGEDPDEPTTPPVLPPELPPPSTQKAGPCSDQQMVSACLKCEVPFAPPLPPPPVLKKAEKLAQIMYLSCPIRNKSDPASYWESPTQLEVRSKVLACNDQLYPETPVSAEQEATLQALLGSDSTVRQRINGGLWYQPPITDHFELYFGITNVEARKLFCYDNWKVSGDLITSEYAQKCMHSREAPECRTWRGDKNAQARWNAVQKIRQDLKSCMDKTAQDNASLPKPAPRTYVCDYQSFEGSYSREGRFVLPAMVAQGYKVSIETLDTCSVVSAKTEAPSEDWVRIVGARCRN